MATLKDLEANWLQIQSAGPIIEQIFSFPHPAAETISALRLIVLDDNKQWILADPANLSHAYRTIGLAQSAISPGQSDKALYYGNHSDSFWNFSFELPLFLGPNGTITQAAPELPDSLFMRVVGTLQNSSSILFNPEEGVFL